MAKKPQPTDAPAINDEAEYRVTLKRPIKLGRSTWARPGAALTLKGKLVRQHIEDIDGYEEIAS